MIAGMSFLIIGSKMRKSAILLIRLLIISRLKAASRYKSGRRKSGLFSPILEAGSNGTAVIIRDVDFQRLIKFRSSVGAVSHDMQDRSEPIVILGTSSAAHVKGKHYYNGLMIRSFKKRKDL